MEDASLRPHRLILSRVQVRCWTAGFTDCDNVPLNLERGVYALCLIHTDIMFDDPLIFELRPCIGARAAILKPEAFKTGIEGAPLGMKWVPVPKWASRAEIISRQAQDC